MGMMFEQSDESPTYAELVQMYPNLHRLFTRMSLQAESSKTEDPLDLLPAAAIWITSHFKNNPLHKAAIIRKAKEFLMWKAETREKGYQCPVCGISSHKMPPSVHCPRHLQCICMSHCYDGCAFYIVEQAHCRYLDQFNLNNKKTGGPHP